MLLFCFAENETTERWISKLHAVKYNYNYDFFLSEASLLGRNVKIVLSLLAGLFLLFRAP